MSAYLFALSAKAQAFTSSKPFEDLPAHYILLIDQSGSITEIPRYKQEIARLLSERILELITHPARNGITLPPYRLGEDYLSVVFFGIPRFDRDFGKLLHPAVTFWRGKDQFQILGQQIYQQSFNRYFSAISIASPLSLPIVRETLSNPRMLSDPKLANTDLRFCRTVGIILTDAMYNVEKSSLDELTYLSRYGQVKGMEEARKKIQEVRRYYDYDLNFWTFFDEGRTQKFLISIREFVPKTVSLSSLLAKVSDVSLDRFAPTSKELYYKGKVKLNFLFPDQSPFCYYLPHELRWKRGGELDYDIVVLNKEHLQAEPLVLPVQFKKPVSKDPIVDSQKVYLAELVLTYDFRDPLYGLNAVIFKGQAFMRPNPPKMLPLPGKWPITDKYLMRHAPASPKKIQSIYFWWTLAIVSFIVGTFVFYLVWPPLKVDIQEVSEDREPVIIDFNSRTGEHTMIIKTFQVINTAGKRLFFIPPLWTRRFPLHIEVLEETKEGKNPSIARVGDLIGLTASVRSIVEKGQFTPGQEIFVFCRPQTIADFMGQGQEAELTYSIRAYRLRRFRFAKKAYVNESSGLGEARRYLGWPIGFFRQRAFPLPTILRDTVKLQFYPEKTFPIPKLEIQHIYQTEGIEHRKGERLPIGTLTVKSSAQHHCSDPVECYYALQSAIKGEPPKETNRYVIAGSAEGNGKAVETTVSIANLSYQEEAHIEIMVDFDRVMNPKIGPDEYELRLCPADPHTGKPSPGGYLDEKFLVKKDSRLSDLILTIAWGNQTANLMHPIQDTFSVNLEYPVYWQKLAPTDWEKVTRLTIQNTAVSGGGKVCYQIGSGILKTSHSGILNLKKGYSDHQIIKWRKSKGKEIPLSGDGDEILSGEIQDGKAPEELTLGFISKPLKEMERKKVKMEIVFPLSYEIKPDLEKRAHGRLNISVNFTLEKYLGPEYLAIDFGTSAVAIAFEGDPTNLGLQDAKGSLCGLLDLENLLKKPLSMNPQAGTRFLPSICCLHPVEEKDSTLNRIGDAAFIHVPMQWDAVGEMWDLVIPYLKMLIGSGVSEIPSEPFEYLDWSGEKKYGNPPLQGVVLSAYKALREQYVEPYLRDSKKEEVWDKLIITYPNTFTFTQVKLLERISRDAFPDKDPIILISESDAVANYYLSIGSNLRSRKDQMPTKEYILIYDIGAGTLDLTYFCVEREERSKTPQRIIYKAKVGVPIAGNHLDIRLGYLVDRRLRAIEEDARQREIDFQYARKIVGVAEHWTPREMFNFWLSILQFKVSYTNAPEESSIPFNLGPVGGPMIMIENFMKDSEFYSGHGLFLEKDEQWGDCYFINIQPQELEKDKGIRRWIHFLTEEVIENALAPMMSPEGKVPLDAVVMSGRTALWPGLKERLISKIKSLSEKPEDLDTPTFGDQELKQAVVLGALAYSLRWRNQIQFEDRNIWGRYGLVYESQAGQETFEDLFPRDLSKVRFIKQNDRIIYLPEGEVTIDISNTGSVRVDCTFVADLDHFLNTKQEDRIYSEALSLPVVRRIPKNIFGDGVREVTCRASVDEENTLHITFHTDQGKEFDITKIVGLKEPPRSWPISPTLLPPE